MVTQIEIKPVLESKGSGRVFFDNGNQTSVDFQFRLLLNGIMEGELDFPMTFAEKYLQLSFSKSLARFELKGNTIIGGKSEEILLTQCYLSSFHWSTGEKSDLMKSKFVAHKAFVNKAAENLKPNNELLLVFDLINVFETFRVIVNTQIGELSLAHDKDIEELQRIMSTYDAPLITSSAQITVKSAGAETLLQIVEKATKIVEGFLKITSLSQGVWHDWVSLSVLEKKTDQEFYERRYLCMRTPKQKKPMRRGITNPAHSQIFMKAAWSGYSDDLETNYGFTRALEWYVEANLATVLESGFLSATTCLELLMDRFHSSVGTEFLIEEDIFEELRKKLENEARQWMKEKAIPQETRAQVCRALKGIRRRQYVDKANQLIEAWHVKVADLKVTAEDVVKIRNQITHKGRVEENDDLFRVYQGLMMILVRIFLSMLKYNDQYYDLARQDWVKFPEITKSSG